MEKILIKAFPKRDIEVISEEIFGLYYTYKPNMEKIDSKVVDTPFIATLERLHKDSNFNWRVTFFPKSWIPDWSAIYMTDFYELFQMGNDHTNRAFTDKELNRIDQILESEV